MEIEIKASKIVLVPINKLKRKANNRNHHPQEQIEALAEHFKYQGFRNPIIVSNQSGEIVSGNGRYLAAIRAGLKELPVVYQDFESPEQEYAYHVADNGLNLWSELDFSGINADIPDLGPDFDIAMLGLKDFEIEPADKYEDKDADETPEVEENIHNVKLGQIWKLGEHRLMCGDSTNEAAVAALMNGEKADMVHTDPPYNVDYSNQDRPKAGKKDLGRIENDKMSDSDFKEFLTKAFTRCYEATKEDSTIYIWYASKESINFMQSVIDSGWELNQQIIWKKPMLLGRGKYQWAHEPCILGIKGSPYFTDDRTKTTVWDFGGYDKSKNVHPTQKPIVIPEEAVKNSSKAGDKVLDLFGGSGSTLIACEKTNRKCFMMELDPHYCSVIIERWQNFTGKKAELLNG